MLIGGGTTLSLPNHRTATMVDCPLQPIEPIKMSLSNGNQTTNSLWSPRFTWKIKGRSFTTKIWVIPLKHWDVILGINWFKQLGQIVINYNSLSTEFYQGNEHFKFFNSNARSQGSNICKKTTPRWGSKSIVANFWSKGIQVYKAQNHCQGKLWAKMPNMFIKGFGYAKVMLYKFQHFQFDQGNS